jgi:hypothetical protein
MKLHGLVPNFYIHVSVSIGYPRYKQKKFRFEPKQDLFRLCLGLFREIQKQKNSVCLGFDNSKKDEKRQNSFTLMH